MSEDRELCPLCRGRGYLLCSCWPGDCICGQGDEYCEYCEGHGYLYPDEDYDPYFDQQCPHD